MSNTSDKRRHHFVPRFYLQSFRSAPRQIHVYVLTQSRAIENASLRDQCYQHRLYGPTDEVENEIGVLENKMAPVLHCIANTGVLPKIGSDQHQTLMSFVALQMLRTSDAAHRVNEGANKFTKQAFSRDPSVDVETKEFGYTYPALASLRHLAAMEYAIADLTPHLVLSQDSAFITSDNPVFKYNQYCESVGEEIGVTGGLSRGLQLFLPLAPTACLLLFDPKVYKVGDRKTSVTLVSKREAEVLRLVQVVGAEKSLYFADWHQVQEIQHLVENAQRYRNRTAMRVREYGAETDERRSLLHIFQPTPNLHLNLSFIGIRRNARRVPVLDRVRNCRKPSPVPDPPEPPNLCESVRFTRPLGER